MENQNYFSKNLNLIIHLNFEKVNSFYEKITLKWGD